MIAGLASGQAGVVARWQLAEAGLTRREIEHRLATGHLHPLHRGVYAAGHTSRAERGRIWAAVLAIGPDAVASHRTAGALWGVRPDNRPVVDVAAPRKVRAREGIRAHQARLAPADMARRAGLPVTSLARTLLDLASQLPPHQTTKALERADKLDLLDGEALTDACARAPGHRGAGRLEEALADYDPRHHQVRSDLERDALPILEAAELPRPAINARLGPFTFDLYWPVERLVVELDSWEHHRTRGAFETDRARDRWLAVRGVERLRITWRQLHDGAAADIAAVLARRRRVTAA